MAKDGGSGEGRAGSAASPPAARPTRCARHDLAAGPDGRCVLCRRTERPAALAREQARGTDRALRSAFKVVVAVAAFLAAFALLLYLFDT